MRPGAVEVILCSLCEIPVLRPARHSKDDQGRHVCLLPPIQSSFAAAEARLSDPPAMSKVTCSRLQGYMFQSRCSHSGICKAESGSWVLEVTDVWSAGGEGTADCWQLLSLHLGRSASGPLLDQSVAAHTKKQSRWVHWEAPVSSFH